MITRQPINGLQPRTEREAGRDAFDWWEAPPASVSLADRWCGRALAVAIALAIASCALNEMGALLP